MNRLLKVALRLLAATAILAVAACGDSDTTPIRNSDAPLSITGAPQVAAGSAFLGAIDRREMDGPADYKLGSNDRLRIIVFGQERLTGEFVLDGSGNLAFPLIGQVAADSMTSKDLERAIAGKLDPDFVHSPSVSVEVVSRRPFFVVGEVQKPGSYPHTAQLNILNAVATAGGHTYRARQDLYYLKRVDRDGNLYRVRATASMIVRPGDVVEVKERSF
jgi:polysaccharide export outer membrane protein